MTTQNATHDNTTEAEIAMNTAEVYAQKRTRYAFEDLVDAVDAWLDESDSDFTLSPTGQAIVDAASAMGYDVDSWLSAGDDHIVVGFDGIDAIDVALTELHAYAARERSHRSGYGVTFDRHESAKYEQSVKFTVNR